MKKILEISLKFVCLSLFIITINEFLIYKNLYDINNGLKMVKEEYINLEKSVDNYTYLKEEIDLVNNEKVSLSTKKDELNNKITTLNKSINSYNDKIVKINRLINNMS